jgi:hypothetical protein
MPARALGQRQTAYRSFDHQVIAIKTFESPLTKKTEDQAVVAHTVVLLCMQYPTNLNTMSGAKT